MSEVPSISRFRQVVDGISSQRDALLIKTTYLTAARISEVLLKTSPYDLEHSKSHPYGKQMEFRIEDYKKGRKKKEQPEKVLLLKLRIAKRKRKTIFKNIALPCTPAYEPWTLDLLKMIQRRGSLGFPMTRYTALRIVKRHLGEEMKTHYLRHYRLTHLVDIFGFDQWDLTIYAGWTFGGAFGSSVPIDDYVHLDWRRYFPKLLRKV